MDIRLAKPSDLIELVYLAKVCSFEMDSIRCFYTNYFNKYVDPLISQNNLFVYRHNECIIGILATNYPEIDQNNRITWNDASGKFMTVHVLAHPKWRGNNIYMFLLNYAEEQAKEKGYHSLRLDASVDNLISLEVIKSNGFRKAGEVTIPFLNSSFLCFEKLI